MTASHSSVLPANPFVQLGGQPATGSGIYPGDLVAGRRPDIARSA